MVPCWLPPRCAAQAPGQAPAFPRTSHHPPPSHAPSPLATECPAPKGNLCSGLGICGFDQAIGASRCFCDDGYISADCSKPASPIPGGAIAGAFFGGSIAASAALLGVGFYLSRKAAPAASDGFYGEAA